MFEVVRLTPADTGLILELQEKVCAGLADATVFQPSSPEFISYCLAAGGRCYGVRRGGETVAYRIVYFPQDREFNLARDSALPPGEYPLVAHWDTVAVLPAWRGHRLAALMNTTALADMAVTRYRHLFATSAPANPHGVRTLIAAGFRPVKVVRKFGGRLRFLLYRPNPGGWPPAGPRQARREIPLDATDELSHAFSSGWVGTAVETAGPAGCLTLAREPVPFAVAGHLPAARLSPGNGS